MPESSATHVIRFTLKGMCITVQTVNVFYYGGTTFAESTLEYLEAFRDDVIAYLAPVTTVSMEYNEIDMQMVKGSDTFDSLAVSIAGTSSGDSLPPFNSWDFTQVRAAAGERNGYKRFAGVPEGLQANGIATSAAETNLDIVADKLDNDLTVGAETWSPVIRRTRVNKVVLPFPKFYTISTVQYSKIGSQNSRKYGHGR